MFFYGRSCSIVLVQCGSQRITDFWRYACYNHLACVSIDDALRKIIPDEAHVVYYKMFIKCGEYEISHISTHSDSFYNHRNCGIEMIGDNETTIIDKSNQSNKYVIQCAKYFTMYNITFCGIELEIFGAYTFIPCTLNVNISNCIFNQSTLVLHNVKNAVIVGCNFNGNDPLNIEMCDISPEMNYTIKDNIFKSDINNDGDTCIIFNGILNSSSTINIINNIISHYKTLCWIDENASILFKNNHISNIKSCIYAWVDWSGGNGSVIIFNNNIFDNVKNVYESDGRIAKLELCDSNTYIDCGPELTRFN